MTYTIELATDSQLHSEQDFPLQYENPSEAKIVFTKLISECSDVAYALYRDGRRITAEDLDPDIDRFEIQLVRAAQCCLPATHRAKPFGPLDLSTNSLGQKLGVRMPANPEDRFE
jgi:hypothetical protein